jgi:iron complex transport system substrate-binding protein
MRTRATGSRRTLAARAIASGRGASRGATARVARVAWLAATLFALPAAAAPVRAVDDAGATIELPAPAARIVTLAPHAAELVYAAGAGERIVAVVKGTDYPPAARALPIVGDAAALDLERIVALAPDLIVTWPWTMPAQVDWLRAHGVVIFEADPHALDAIPADVERLGALAGTVETASRAAAALRERIGRLARPPGERLRVFYQVSDPPLFTLGGAHLVSRAIEQCGGENVFAALRIPAPQVGIEAVLAADPQVIVAGTADARRPSWLDMWMRWPALDAARHHALYTVDANLLHRPGPRFVDGVEQLCATLATARRERAAGAYNQSIEEATGSAR